MPDDIQTEGSEKFQLNKADGLKIVKGLLIACGGAALTYIAGILPGLDLGRYQLVLFPLLSALINAGVKWARDNSA